MNADGYVSTGSGVLDTNMFAYCGNNPVNMVDESGTFFKQIGSWMKNAWNSVKSFVKNTFGAGSSTSTTIAKTEVQYLPDPLPITAKVGSKTTKSVSKHGDSSKPISVYANRNAEHPIKSSSAGIKINISSFTFNINLSLDDLGISGSIVNGDTTNSIGIKANLSEVKLGVESSSAVKWDNATETTYANVYISGWAIVAAVVSAVTGQVVTSPSAY